jgi:hypothetical protein
MDDSRNKVSGGDPNLPESTKEKIEGIADVFAKLPPVTESDQEKYPNYYRLREKFADTKKGMLGQVLFVRHPEDEWYDMIVTEIIERYKTSGLSGDEWRFSYVARIFWKGQQIGVLRGMNMEKLVRKLDYHLNLRDQLDKNDPEYIHWPDEKERAEYCAQPGCCNKATTTYRLKHEYCSGFGGCGSLKRVSFVSLIRFCQKHVCRGDCALQDADSNYVLVEGPGLDAEDTTDKPISESGFGGVIDATGN